MDIESDQIIDTKNVIEIIIKFISKKPLLKVFLLLLILVGEDLT